MIFGWLWKASTVVLVGVLLGFGAYHLTVTVGLKADLATAHRAIERLATERASFAVDNVALHITNGALQVKVEKQNDALAALAKERDDALAAWRREVNAGVARSKAYEVRIAAIRAARAAPGQPWHERWQELLDQYFVDRKTQ